MSKPLLPALRKFALVLLMICLLSVALILATISTTIPEIAKRYLANYDIELEIGKLDINLFNASIVIKDISVVDNSFIRPLSIASIEIEIALRELINNKQYRLEQFDIRDAIIPVHKKDGRYWLAGIDAERFNDPNASENDNGGKEEETPTTPIFGWQALLLSNINIHYQDYDGVEANQKLNEDKSASAKNAYDPIEVNIAKLNIGALHSLKPKEKTTLQAQFEMLEAQLSFAGDISPLDTGKQGHLSTSLKTFDIASFASLAESLALDVPEAAAGVDGTLSYEGRIDWWITEQRVFVNALASNLAIADLGVILNKAGPTEKNSETTNAIASNQSLKGSIQILGDEIKVALNPLHIKTTQWEFISPDLHFKDNSVTPAAVVELSDLSIVLDKYDNSAKAKNQKSTIKLVSQMGEFGSLKRNLELALNDIKNNGLLTFSGEQINLTQFSGFTADALGKQINKGALDFNVNANIETGVIDSQIKLEAHQLSFVKAKLEKINQDGGFETELGMPINTALNLLRDKDDTIRLSIPINGPVDDPKIRLNKIVNAALFKTLKTAVLTQVGPLMALTAIDKVQSLHDAAKLKPVVYAPLEDQFATEQIA